MAELAASAFAAMSAAAVPAAASTAAAGTAAAATSAAAWAAGTTTAAAGAAGTASSTIAALQGYATIASMASALVGGAMSYRQSQDQGRFADLQAEGERLSGEEQALRIRRETVQKIAAARVANAASGTDISGIGAIEDSLNAEAEFETGLSRDSAAMRTAGARANAQQIRNRGVSSLISAAGKATGAKLDYDVSIARRG